MSTGPPIVAYVGEVGRVIHRNLRFDLSALSTPVVTLEMQKPSGATVSWSTVQLPATSEGYGFVKRTTEAGDLDEGGLWHGREKVTAGTTVRYFDGFTLLVKNLHDR